MVVVVVVVEEQAPKNSAAFITAYFEAILAFHKPSRVKRLVRHNDWSQL